jgi:hypothetical protein
VDLGDEEEIAHAKVAKDGKGAQKRGIFGGEKVRKWEGGNV